MRNLLISTFCLLNFTSIIAQVNTAEQFDFQTYNSFINKDYNHTIQLATVALQQGIDFYFLRYRLGVSYFEKKNYVAAATHLENAYSTDKTDPVLQEYLYYSLRFSNQLEKANLLAETFSNEVKLKINYHPKVFESIAIEGGYLFTDYLNKIKNKDLLQANTFAAGNFYSDVTFGNFYIKNQFSPRFTLLNNGSIVSNTSNLLTQEKLPEFKESIYSNKNMYYQYNSIASYYRNSWTLTAGAGYYYSTYSDYSVAPTFSPSGIAHFPLKSLDNYSGSVGIAKRLKYVEPAISLSYSNFQKLDNYSAEASITYYPFGNLRLFGNSKAAYQTNSLASNTIYTQLIGIQLSKIIWCELFGAYGNHTNYIADNGQIVYNTPNTINWYAGGNLNFYFNKLDFSVGYNIQERESFYVSGIESVNYRYNYNLIKSKITWKF